MTADGTITPQVGGTITERSALNALPAGTVLRDTLTGCVLTILADDHDQPAGIEAVAGSSSWSLSHGLTVLHRPDAPQPGTTGDAVVTRAEAERMVTEQREIDLAMHKAYRPEVVAEVAAHLSEEADWDAVAKWCGGTIRTGQEPSGEYVSDMHIPGVGTAWQGAWIVQRHDRTFAIRAEVEGPSAESVAALGAARAGGAEPSPLCDCGEPKDGHSHPRTGEAVDREALGREVRTAVSLWDNDGDVRGRPDEVWAAIDREAAYITRHLLDTVLAARGDPVTATVEQIAEVLREHYGPLWCPTCHPAGRRDWDEPWDVIRHQAEQIAALGVGDGEVEDRVQWGVQAEGLADGAFDDVEPGYSEQDARDRLAEMLDPDVSEHGIGYPDAHLVQRTVGPWVEVTDEGGEE